MTTNVVTVGPDATCGEVVDRLLAHDISSLPGIDDSGQLLGIVTGADLVSREAHGPERRRPLGLLLDYLQDRDPAWVRKASGAMAREPVTRVVTTAAPDDDLATAARRMLEGGTTTCRWSPLGGWLGSSSRPDLLAPAYAARRPPP